jgi:hypothetical protein
LTRWRRLDGGNEEDGALVRFGYSRAEESGRRLCTARQWLRRDRGRRKPEWPVWAESTERSGPVVRFSKETTWAIKVNRAELTMGCGKFFSQFSNKDLGFKIKDFKFQTKIELG